MYTTKKRLTQHTHYKIVVLFPYNNILGKRDRALPEITGFVYGYYCDADMSVHSVHTPRDGLYKQ